MPRKMGKSLVPRMVATNGRGHALPRDSYEPGRDRVAPISLRAIHMELVWICGDCGAHYPRTTNAPSLCGGCGAPRQHFYSPPED